MERSKLSANLSWQFYRGDAPLGREADSNNPHAHGLPVYDARYDDSGWEIVHLPHTVREETLMCSGGRNYQGVCWYRKRFILPDGCEGNDVYFELEAAMQRVDAWLDGLPLGTRFGGFLPVRFDLTGLATGQHLLVLKVDNSDMIDVPPGKPQGSMDFCYFGGLYRDAWLHIWNPVRFTSAVHEGRPAGGGLFVRYPQVSRERAAVRVTASYVNHSPQSAQVCVQLLLDGKAVSGSLPETLSSGCEGQCELAFTVEHPALWHPDTPHLYTLTARLVENGAVVDEISQRIGIRSIAFHRDGFYINGEKFFLHGANRHQEYPYVGFAITDAAQWRDVKRLRDTGMVVIRTAHYPQDTAFMDACDELGVLCILPNPGWQIHPSSVIFDERSYENIRRIIRMYRNHASAMLWEPLPNETDCPTYFVERQLAIVREEMGDTEAWCACDSYCRSAEAFPVNYTFQENGKPFLVREYGDNYIEQYAPTKTLRRVRRGEHASYYPGGERAMLRSAAERFEIYKTLRMRENMAGCVLWAGIDCNRGYELNEGAWGIFDLLRLPKFSQKCYDAQQEYALAGGKCFIANYWTESSQRDVTVYSNADEVVLFLNGTQIDRKSVEKPTGNIHVPVVFAQVPWQPGTLCAQALIGGTVVAQHTVRTPSTPARIVLQADSQGLDLWIADGADLLLVHAYVVDGAGTVVPTAEPEIRFTVSGSASIVGDGLPWVASNPIRAEAGATGVVLRAGLEPGEITLTAQAEGLAAGSLMLTTTPADRKWLDNAPVSGSSRPYIYPVDGKEYFSLCDAVRLSQRSCFNKCTGKPAAASSWTPGGEPENANRQDSSDCWIAAAGQFPQWWQCDLEANFTLNGMSVSWEKDGAWYDYVVETSLDGAAWRRCLAGYTSGQSRKPLRFEAPVAARYIRIVIHAVTSGDAAGIRQVEVYGDNI